MPRMGFQAAHAVAASVALVAVIGGLASSPAALSSTRTTGGGTIAFVRFSDSIGRPRLFIARPGDGGAVLVPVHLGAVDGPAWSPDGRSLIVVGGVNGHQGPRVTEAEDLYLVRRDGRATRRLTHDAAHESGVAWAPDGKRIVYVRSSLVEPNQSSLYLRGMAVGARPRRLTFGSTDLQPSWSSNGRWLAFLRISPRTRTNGIWVVRPDGSGLHRVLGPLLNVTDPVWSPRGNRLVVSDGTRLMTVRATGTARHAIARLAADGHGSRLDPEPAWSPDGTRIVFTQMRSGSDGRADLWIVGADGRGLVRLTHSNGLDFSPSWGS